MAEMGSTGAIILTKGDLDKAMAAIDTYKTNVATNDTDLATEITGLIPSSFDGDAATGFKAFYDSNISDNVGKNLTDMLDGLKDICDTIKKSIPGDEEGVDSQLGEGNRGASGSEGQ